MENYKKLSPEQREKLITVLKARFHENMARHKGLEWSEIEKKLEAENEKLCSLREMERTGGEPDVVDFDKASGLYVFCDCSQESPAGLIRPLK